MFMVLSSSKAIVSLPGSFDD